MMKQAQECKYGHLVYLTVDAFISVLLFHENYYLARRLKESISPAFLFYERTVYVVSQLVSGVKGQKKYVTNIL